MRLRVVSSALIAIAALPLAAVAQNAASSSPPQGELRQELQRKRYVVLPKPSVDTVKRDAQQAADEITAPQRQDEALRDARQRPLNRPDLDHDVVQGVQAQQVNKARR